MASGQPHLAATIIVACRGQSAHRLVIDVERGAWTIEGLTLIHGCNRLFWNAWGIKHGTRHPVQDVISLWLARGYLGKAIVFPLIVRIGALRFKLRLGSLLR